MKIKSKVAAIAKEVFPELKGKRPSKAKIKSMIVKEAVEAAKP